MANIKYEVKQVISTMSVNSKGWKKQLNLVSWNDAEPKFDIRTWDDTHTKMGKGITLSENELKELYRSLQVYFGDSNQEKPTNVNVTSIIVDYTNKAPLFINELRNIFTFMEDSGYTTMQIKQLLIEQSLVGVPISLINEIESLGTIYQPFYGEFVELVKDLDDVKFSELVRVIIEGRVS